MIDTAAINAPIPFSLTFTAQIVIAKNNTIRITSNANKNPLIINKSPFHNPYTSKHAL